MEEAILRLDGDDGRIELPTAIVADREPDGWLDELRWSPTRWPWS